MERLDRLEYKKELFDRLKKSLSLKSEKECFGACLGDASWWILENSNYTSRELKKAVSESCVVRKGPFCLTPIVHTLNRAKKTRRPETFVCPGGRHGFVYPITQGDTIYGFIGTCYSKKEISNRLLRVFASFTDTVVRELQKEMELAKLYETIRPRAIALSTVHTVHRLLTSTLDLNELLPRIARLSLQVIRANRCSIKLLDSKRRVLLPKATVDLRGGKIRLKKVKLGKWAPGRAAKFAKPVRGNNYLAVPLIDEDVIGVITIYDRLDGKQFDSFDQEIMATLAEQAVIAIKNAQLYKEQERLTLGGIKSLAMVLSAKSHGEGISPRPSYLRIVSLVGQMMRLNTHEIRDLEYAILLHDAGQIVVPDEFLTKPESLTVEEYDLVKEHPVRSVNIIRPIKALKSVIPILLHHHENYDGSGYPKKLRDGQIPLGARIMAIVGSFEAMTTKRAYRPARSLEQAEEEIKSQSSRQFDPKIVEAFLKVVHRHDIRMMLEKECREFK